MEDATLIKSDNSMPAAWQVDKDLGDCMIKLFEKQLWTDVKFRCNSHDEHQIIHALKIVLAARSPVFQAMFFGPCANTDEEIVLDNTDAETFNLFLSYIYQDKMVLTEDIATSVLETAHFYQVTNLVIYCADFLASCITSQNVCGILSLARFYKIISLCKACCIFIDENANEVMETEGFLKLTEENLTYVMKGDTFYADEVDILKKAEEWAQRKIEESNLERNGQNVRKVLGASFFHLRLPSMKLDKLLACTRRKGYFSAEEYEDLADFIHKKPNSTVITNSCIYRVQTVERMDFHCLQKSDDVVNGISMTHFQLSANRDVKVKTVELAKINAHLDIKRFASLKSFYANRNDENLLSGLDIVLSVHLKVKCNKNIEELLVGTEKDLVYEQELKLTSTGEGQIINLTKPLIIEKSRSPYTFELYLKYGGERLYLVQMKTVKTSAEHFTSDDEVVTVNNLCGNFTGIRGISYENFSNRD